MDNEKVMITAQVDKEFYELVRKAAYVLHISNSEVIRRSCAIFIKNELREHLEEIDEKKLDVICKE